jgi:steroid delta-isomerase-like uncharacterized protein
MAQATTLSPQALITTARAMIEVYNDRNWDRAKTIMTPDFVYDEVATGRKVTGADAAIEAWKGWAQAFPDAKGTIHRVNVSETGAAVVEVTWKGTHQGTLQTPNGSIAATGKPIEVRACAVMELKGEKVGVQRHYFDMVTLLQQLGATASSA